ncbi:rCG45723, partial [Rattus norvegicus]
MLMEGTQHTSAQEQTGKDLPQDCSRPQRHWLEPRSRAGRVFLTLWHDFCFLPSPAKLEFLSRKHSAVGLAKPGALAWKSISLSGFLMLPTSMKCLMCPQGGAGR